MNIGKREIALLSVLGVLLYGLIFYKFIYANAKPEITAKKAEIEAAQKQKDALDNDLANIESKRLELRAKSLNNERLQEYLLENGNLTDGVEYVAKLASMMPKISGISINAPSQKTDNGKTFYEMAISFNCKSSYLEAMELVRFFELSTTKVRVSKFTMQPVKADAKDSTTKGAINVNQLFDLNFTINIYSINAQAADKLTEYSRHKFTSYIGEEGVVFIPNTKVNNARSEVAVAKTSSATSKAPEKADTVNYVIDIKEYSYLVGGENLEIFGGDGAGKTIRVKTKKSHDITISLANNAYVIDSVDEYGNPDSIFGTIPGPSMGISVEADIPNLNENKDIKLNIKIVNDSSSNIKLKLYDKQNKVNIIDRNGGAIGGSGKEKVTIVGR